MASTAKRSSRKRAGNQNFVVNGDLLGMLGAMNPIMETRIAATILLLAAPFAAGFQATEDGIYATFQTSMGNFTAVLHHQDTPLAVANFIGLAEGTRKWIDPRNGVVRQDPYYNDLIFHRVIDGFMIQTGSPSGDGTDGPGYTFRDEFKPHLRHDAPGVLAMANRGPHTNGSQIYITVAATHPLDDRHTVFGRIVEGLEVVTSISKVQTSTDPADRPIQPITINGVTVHRLGTRAEAFDVSQPTLPEVVPDNPDIRHSSEELYAYFQRPAGSIVTVYYSSDLSEWESLTSNYFVADRPELPFPLLHPHEPDTPQFFRFSNVRYPINPGPGSMENRTMSIITDHGALPDTLQLSFGLENTGIVTTTGLVAFDGSFEYFYQLNPYNGVMEILFFDQSGTTEFAYLYILDLEFDSADAGAFRGQLEIYRQTATSPDWEEESVQPISGTFTLLAPGD